jgi:nitrile hydratase accessory protein
MPSLRGVPLLPKDADGPVFTSPWEARAFAIVVLLYQQGHFTWQEWVKALSAEIASAKAAGRADYGSAYYSNSRKTTKPSKHRDILIAFS